jgi:transposase
LEVLDVLPFEPDSPYSIEQVKLDGEVVVLEVVGSAPEGRCPGCGAASRSVHDRYTRRPLDLPWRGRVVRLALRVRRFRCRALGCRRATFAEEFGRRLPRRARRTAEATSALLHLARTAGGEAGARLADGSGLPVSPDTLLRLERRAVGAGAPTPCVLGVDDLALRRGRRYATILVDLETHRPIDLLSGRTAETLAAWLREHPGVEVISRDRAEAYAEGARTGAPRAIQVADRFHLRQNASAALEEVLRGRRRHIVHTADAASHDPAIPVEARPRIGPSKQQAAARRDVRRARWQRVWELYESGRPKAAIAREVGLDRKTIRRYLATPRPTSDVVPPRRPRPGGLTSRLLQPHVAYLQDRWQAGCTNVSQLFREIRAKGYPGSRTLLDQALRPWRPPKRERRRTKRLSVRWLCLRPPEGLDADERAALREVLDTDAAIAAGYGLLQDFRTLMAARDPALLDPWLTRARDSGLGPFASLAAGIRADRAAVESALRLPWSNGPVEGHVHRVKLIKRRGYGRARLDLLRARVLAG